MSTNHSYTSNFIKVLSTILFVPVAAVALLPLSPVILLMHLVAWLHKTAEAEPHKKVSSGSHVSCGSSSNRMSLVDAAGLCQQITHLETNCKLNNALIEEINAMRTTKCLLAICLAITVLATAKSSLACRGSSGFGARCGPSIQRQRMNVGIDILVNGQTIAKDQSLREELFGRSEAWS